MTTIELYCKGAKIWIPHPEKVWESGELSEDYDLKTKVLKIVTESNDKKTITIKLDTDLPPLCNPSILIGENDLTSLSYLHEPAVLYNLQVRFCSQRAIYTYCGIVLVAINPYDDLPIYDTDTMRAYRGQAMGDLDPHVFAVAEEAYTRLEREQRHQSVVVSGESGAGKTVSAKYAMRYFATVSGSDSGADAETHVEKKVLASSPIMEAIGNAKTTRNDNSSRFGKYIEIHFNKCFYIIGASMRTYLLEKSRVVFQAPDERNYHIFYQLCSAHDQYPELKLGHCSKFRYLNQGNSNQIDGVNDKETFDETVSALVTLGFSKREQFDMFKILAAILHLGNVRFFDLDLSGDHSQEDSEGCSISEEDQHLKAFAELMQVDSDEMMQWLCTRKIVSTKEVFIKPMTIKQAERSRDALAKHIYAELFAWIVEVINKALEASETSHKFIGVLDIYGFETFEINSFEQFCINYANEKLQQQFNQHVFKLEQEEYIKEQIEWKMIEFYDNQPCIDLIEIKLGILDLLDEECRMPKGSDSSWVEKLYTKCSKHKHFVKPRFGTSAFIINHFADQVQYESGGFLEKNRDTVIEEQISVIRNSENKLVKKLFTPVDERKLSVPSTKVKITATKAALPPSQRSNKKTVGSQFRDSLNALMSTLNATTPHYVRCIKPNDDKTAFEYNPMRAVQQLRACGVLETVRISAAGFPSRWFYSEFFSRYRVLCKFKDINRNDMKQTCEKILDKNIKQSDKYQFGKTKIFFRAGQVAYLEKLRADKLKKCCIIVQSQIRAFICRKKYLKIKLCALNLQRYARGYLARQLATDLRREKAAKVLQRYVRGWVKRVQYLRTKRCVLGLQTRARGYLARRRFMELKYNAKAKIIQTCVRGWLARRRYAKDLHSVIICQSAIRRFIARRLFRKLRIEARSVEHVKKLNKGLENKIISLQQKIGELHKENNQFKNAQNELNDLRLKIEGMRLLEIEIKKLHKTVTEKDQFCNELKERLKLEEDEKMDLLQEQEKYRKETEKIRTLWTEENIKLKEELDNLNEMVKNTEIGAEETLKTRIEQEKLMLMTEQEQERDAYQRLLREHNTLEQHCEALESQLSRYARTGKQATHTRNSSDVSGISNNDENVVTTTDIADEDYGYGSVRSNTSTVTTGSHSHLDTIDWRRNETVSPEPPNKTTPEQSVDIGLVLKLQHKIKEIETEKESLQKRLDSYEQDGTNKIDESVKNIDAIRISELELKNAKLQKGIEQLRASLTEAAVLDQFAELQEERDRKNEECIQLRSVLGNMNKSMSSSVYDAGTTVTNEDAELALAYEAQKKINQQLEIEFQKEKKNHEVQEAEFRHEIEQLRKDNERLQKLLSVGLTQSPASQTEAYLRHEIARIATENLTLSERADRAEEQARQYKKNAKALAKKLRDLGLLEVSSDLEKDRNILQESKQNLPVVRKKERDYEGMFEYRKEDEATIIKRLIYELKPRVAVTLLPGLPAYIMFMCIRHTDFISDDDKVRSMLTAVINGIKKVIRKRNEDLETTVLWLTNTLRLLHNLKQYSGDASFQHANTPKQNEQCLRNFDLSEYRQVLSDITFWIYQAIIRNMEEKVHSLIVPAILEHEAISNISGNKPTGVRSRSVSDASTPTRPPPQALVAELNNFHKILGFYGVDPELITQIFRQIFFFICATSLNNLLLRKEFCHWSKGCQIRYNLSNLEMWTRDKRLDQAPILETLQPIIQAAQLLQARKTEEDVASVCDMCSQLTTLQICKILQMYTPLDEYEERVPPAFIRRVEATLKESRNKPDSSEEGKLLLDVKFNYSVLFPFNPSNICLEDIEIPEVLNLPMLKKV